MQTVKTNIIFVKKSLIEWSLTLKEVSDELWLKPFDDSTWGIADVVSHFISWDHFIINNRLNYLLRGEPFPKIPVQIEEVNKKASIYARSGITKEDLINEFISVRFDLIALLSELPDERFEEPCQGLENVTLSEYLKGILDHDLKHKQQIDQYLDAQKAPIII